MFVHLPPYSDYHPVAFFSNTTLLWFFNDCVGRSSLPLLSVISGYLALRLSHRRRWIEQVGHKFLTLIAPMVIWNIIALCSDVAQSHGNELPALASLPNQVMALTAYPRVTPLYFFRDVFVCSMLAPLFAAVMRRAALPALLLLGVNALFGLSNPVFLNAVIPLFFGLGCAIEVGAIDARAIVARWRWLLAISLTIWAVKAAFPFVTPGAFHAPAPSE